MQQCTGKMRSLLCVRARPSCLFVYAPVCMREHEAESCWTNSKHQPVNTGTGLDRQTGGRADGRTHAQRGGHTNPAGTGARKHTDQGAHTLPSSWFFSSSCDSSCLRRSSTLPWRSSACRGRHLHMSAPAGDTYWCSFFFRFLFARDLNGSYTFTAAGC